MGMASVVDLSELVNAPQAKPIEVVPMGDGNAAQGNGCPARLTWTNVMSRFILYCFSNLVREGLKTYKVFKEVNLNQVAKDLFEFAHVEVTGTQVNNHLRKWCAKWVKICRLRELSGALWNEGLFIIWLDDEHYNGNVKVRL
ncbi:hypothetical protein C2845_PM12G08690 [Panicum miliaceum]|uniref:Myb/SANT-like domain-containing protein n=1 Tax=Panicum miliaceum TaxID=4540 RepID=A0A3L6QIS4_PANMI|nr:hypothetical protein C2845_PM12G08690 [Panicum miliaceum]